MANAPPIYDTIAVIGCGLIGGSLVRAARKTGAAKTIVVCELGAAKTRVEELGIADRVTSDLAEAVRGADLVVFATPVRAIGPAAEIAAAAYKRGATITDVGSVKGAVGQALRASAPKTVHVIPGHPIAGTEHSGPDSGFPELFENRWTILTPAKKRSAKYKDALDLLEMFWTRLGARVDQMDERHHDLVLAVTSHLPHLIAYNIVGTADDLEKVTQSEVIKYSAGGFRDFTRIAASDPVMWRDVFLTNKDAVLYVLKRFQKDLGVLTNAMKKGDGETLQTWFTHTRAIRRGIIEAGQETAEPDFGRHHGYAPLTSEPAPALEALKPAVPIKKSITPDYLISLEDGKKYKSLKRHLRIRYGMSPDDYRTKWGLPKDYPMVAPNSASSRSALAKSMGLGGVKTSKSPRKGQARGKA